ncbi:tetratricopeptide repeat protein [Streptomyces adustus]|uniref:tetratricopeptide repeat protein n=1 Tax=Streptomyces adustus TaxID=1609272 RepID=UPI003710228F
MQREPGGGEQPVLSRPLSPDTEEVWQRLRTALEADEQGRLVLAQFGRGQENAEVALTNWLAGRPGGAAVVAAQVTGGTIGQLVLIAKAQAVHYYGRLATPPAPRQLPQAPADFTDRVAEADELGILLTGPGRSAAEAVCVTGQPGIGKTALALKIAHDCARVFSDGQLYADLGNDADPIEPVRAALGGFLHALGVPLPAIPESLHDRSSLYRTYTADRKLLVVVDNAWTEQQIRPLLLSGKHSALLVTSRRQLLALDGAQRVHLALLAHNDAVELLARAAGAQGERIRKEHQQARLIAGLCGYLPLAVRIVGVRLGTPPFPSLTWMLRRLLDEQRRLAELNVGDRGVRAAYMISYERLDEQGRRLFRLLGLIECPSFAPWMAAALLGTTEADGERALADLADQALLEPVGEDTVGQLRYRFHDLLGVFARERPEEEPDLGQRDAALRQLVETACGLTGHHSLQLLPDAYLRPFRDPALRRWIDRAERLPVAQENSESWLVEEEPVLFQLLGKAHVWGYHDAVWRFALALQDYCEQLGRLTAWVELSELALASAQHLADPTALGYARRGLGVGLVYQGHGATAIVELTQACTAGEETADRMLHATSLRALGEAYCLLSDLERARDCFDQAMAAFSELNEPSWEAWTAWSLGALGIASPDRQVAQLNEAVGRFEQLGDARGIAVALRSIGEIHLRQGDDSQAMHCLEQCLPLFRSVRARVGEALTMDTLGRLYLGAGRQADALSLLEDSAPFLDRLGEHEGLM